MTTSQKPQNTFHLLSNYFLKPACRHFVSLDWKMREEISSLEISQRNFSGETKILQRTQIYRISNLKLGTNSCACRNLRKCCSDVNFSSSSISFPLMLLIYTNKWLIIIFVGHLTSKYLNACRAIQAAFSVGEVLHHSAEWFLQSGMNWWNVCLYKIPESWFMSKDTISHISWPYLGTWRLKKKDTTVCKGFRGESESRRLQRCSKSCTAAETTKQKPDNRCELWKGFMNNTSAGLHRC